MSDTYLADARRCDGTTRSVFIDTAQLHRRRGRLPPGELTAVEQELATVIRPDLADPDWLRRRTRYLTAHLQWGSC